MNFKEFLTMRYFFVFVEQRVLKFSKLLFENKLTGHKNFTCDDDVQEIKLTMEYFWVLVNIRI